MQKGTRSGPLFCEPAAGRARPDSDRGRLPGGLGYPVTLQALRADSDTTGRPFHQHAHGLQVRIPAALGPVVGMAHIIAGDRPFAAHGADPCHMLHPLLSRHRTPETPKPNRASRMTLPATVPRDA